jgi:hypothetical protein
MKFGYSAYQILRVERSASAPQISAAHRALSEALEIRTDLAPRIRANLQRSLDDALYTLADPQLRAEHDAWIARHEHGARLDGAHAVILPPQTGPAANEDVLQQPAAAPQTPSAWAHVRVWLAKLRKAGSAVRLASRTLL